MALVDLQPEPLALLDAVIARAADVVAPGLLRLVTEHIEHALADGPQPRLPRTPLERDVLAMLEQELVDVAGATDDLVRRAAEHFPAGGLADLAVAAYAIEARTRLRVAADRLWGGAP